MAENSTKEYWKPLIMNIGKQNTIRLLKKIIKIIEGDEIGHTPQLDSFCMSARQMIIDLEKPSEAAKRKS
jgi:hypothetical protein